MRLQVHLWPLSVNEGSGRDTSFGIGRIGSMDPGWLWCSQADAALSGRLAWDLLHATGAAVKRKKNLSMALKRVCSSFLPRSCGQTMQRGKLPCDDISLLHS